MHDPRWPHGSLHQYTYELDSFLLQILLHLGPVLGFELAGAVLAHHGSNGERSSGMLEVSQIIDLPIDGCEFLVLGKILKCKLSSRGRGR